MKDEVRDLIIEHGYDIEDLAETLYELQGDNGTLRKQVVDLHDIIERRLMRDEIRLDPVESMQWVRSCYVALDTNKESC